MRGPQARTGKDKNRKDRIEEMQSSLEKVRDDKMTEFSSLERRLGKKILDINSVGIVIILWLCKFLITATTKINNKS